MNHNGRIAVVLIYTSIVIGWHAFYFIVDFQAAHTFLIERQNIIWDFIFIPLLSPIFIWLGYQYDKAKFLSEKDALTGLYNRRYVTKIVPKLLLQADKNREGLTISIIDCDNFKEINDTYGHDTGDQILEKISRLLEKNTNKQDIIARWGGDEFLIIIRKANIKKPKEIERKIKQAMEHLSREMSMDIAVSIGTAAYPKEAASIKELFAAADHRMYADKLKRQQEEKSLRPADGVYSQDQ